MSEEQSCGLPPSLFLPVRWSGKSRPIDPTTSGEAVAVAKLDWNVRFREFVYPRG